MKSVVLALPTFVMILTTRAALAAGVMLLVSDKVPRSRRKQVGAALVAIGAATTAPAVMSIMRGMRKASGYRRPSIDRDRRLIGATRFPRKGQEDLFTRLDA